jgi:hypothetical protein
MSIFCGSCGRWKTDPIHCHQAIITILCIKKYTNTLDALNKDVINHIIKFMLKDAKDSGWQAACQNQREWLIISD